jgi:hypothetical protein
LIICISITLISWINISKIFDIIYVDEAIFFIKELLIINRFLIFFESVINFTFSLKKRFVVITFFLFFQLVANVQSVSWRSTFVNCSFLSALLSWRSMFFFNFLQLFLLFDVIIQRYNVRRRRVNFVFSFYLRRNRV